MTERIPLIFDIKRYAINDGPGIRTTLFIKGCPLRCAWCHNPESWDPSRQLLYKQGKCIGCHTCVNVCKQHALAAGPEGIIYRADKCILCGRCTDECPTMALEMCGKTYDMETLMAEMEKERSVMEDSGGGVTVCGGEPLMFPAFLLKILRELRQRGFHRTVDTSLYASRKVVQQVAAECELMLVDLKVMDAEKHRLFTRVDNSLILDNIQWLASEGYDFLVRIPLIDGINADDDNITATAQFVESLPGNHPVHLLPYHDVGKDKHRRMGSEYNPRGWDMQTPTEHLLRHCSSLLTGEGLDVIIGG